MRIIAVAPVWVLATGIALFAVAASIGPLWSHPGYSPLAHSLSELAGQAMPHAWIMRGGFVGFGLAVGLASLMRWRHDPLLHLALLLFGLAMLAAAFWSHLPIAAVGGGSRREDDLHSLAASAMGVAFTVACVARLRSTWALGVERLTALALLAAIILPLVMLLQPTIAGAAQRMMFAISFAWLLWLFGGPRRGGH